MNRVYWIYVGGQTLVCPKNLILLSYRAWSVLSGQSLRLRKIDSEAYIKFSNLNVGIINAIF